MEFGHVLRKGTLHNFQRCIYRRYLIVIYCMIVYVKLSRQVCNIANCKYCLYNVLLLSRVHPYPVIMIELSVVE